MRFGHIRQRLTDEERRLADEGRIEMLDEMEHFPAWIENRIGEVTPAIRLQIERWLTAMAEMFQELSVDTRDTLTLGMATAAALAVQRCQMRVSPSFVRSPAPCSVPSALSMRAIRHEGDEVSSDDSWPLDD